MIICCGEALIDMLPRRSTLGETAFSPYPGGGMLNSAIALGRLGANAGLYCGISSDMFGQLLRKTLAASHVDERYLHPSPLPTTLAFVQLNNGQASYFFFDENTAGRMLVEADLPALGNEVEALLFGGISLIAEPCGSTYETFMRRESQNRTMILDPNIRPDFIDDHTRHRARINSMMTMADIVKLSDEDLAWFGHAGSPDDFAQDRLRREPGLIVITHGEKGTVGYTRNHRIAIAAPTVEVVDTVGAGDTFNGGLLASLQAQGLLGKGRPALLSAEQLHAALEMASHAAAISVSRAGANPPWRHELA
ncbi:carbohydrate kinase [Aquamicrobium segne]|uniref:Carbohydrate kinase n=1 Tax=Aquamicrobium segne TaxID=469547 RepID=A0ABW0GUH2_9HYPH